VTHDKRVSARSVDDTGELTAGAVGNLGGSARVPDLLPADSHTRVWVVTQPRPDRASNPRPLDGKNNAQRVAPARHPVVNCDPGVAGWNLRSLANPGRRPSKSKNQNQNNNKRGNAVSFHNTMVTE